MNEIVFERPYILYMLIALGLFLVIPLIILIIKRRVDFKAISSFVLHLLIFTCLTISISGIKGMITIPHDAEEVFVVADLSFSNHEQLEKMDNCIKQIKKDLKDDVLFGVVGFGKNAKQITAFNEEFISVMNQEIDASATDIANALNYTQTLFSNNSYKRIILLSDGKQTDGNAVLTAEKLISQNIHIDAMNFNEEISSEPEVQINQVIYTPSTFINHKEEVYINVQTNFEDKVDLTLYKNDSIYLTGLLDVTSGLNVFRFTLDTSQAKTNSYKVNVSSPNDHNDLNNDYYFTQQVHEVKNILVIPNKNEDNSDFYKNAFTEKTNLEFYDYSDESQLQLEALCHYDEIVLDNINLSDFINPEQFVYDLDSCASVYGKSIFTVGDVTASDDISLSKRMENILPLRFHPTNESRIVALVIDCSMSMADENRLNNAKSGAKQCIERLDSSDYILIEAFYNDVKIVQPLTKLTNVEAIYEAIDSIKINSDTHIGNALDTTFSQIKNLDFDSKQVVLLSDGEPTDGDSDPLVAAQEMAKQGIYTSVINISSMAGAKLMNDIAQKGNGSYYYVNNAEDIASIMVNAIEDEFIEDEIEGIIHSSINNIEHPTMIGIEELPILGGYHYSRIKGSAQMLASTTYINNIGGERTCPLYATWNYGKGKVSSFTSELYNWGKDWKDNEVATLFFTNISSSLIPDKRVNTSFNIQKQYNGYTTTIYVNVINSIENAVLTIKLTDPNQETQTQNLTLNDSQYSGDFITSHSGQYQIELTYGNDEQSLQSIDYFDFSYSSEYNCFDSRKEALLYQIISSNGDVYDQTDAIKNIEHSDRIITKNYSIYFIIIALCLFILEIAIKKITLKGRRKK